ncbi:hypothetical protein DIPPA_30384 [Diplonema papillatum]|nr:hypothetical protein DIPPA_30384 [Diplonema papillatum]
MSGRGRYGGGGGRGMSQMGPRQAAPAAGQRPQGRGQFAGTPPRQGARVVAQPARGVQRPGQSQRMSPYPSPQASAHSPGAGKGGKNSPQANQSPASTAARDQVREHSFSLKVRSLVDHRIRTPHRRCIHPQLVRTIAHWVTLPAHTVPLLSQRVEIEKKKDLDSAQTATITSTPEADSGVVNARVLLCPGLASPSSSTDKTPVLSRLSIFAGKRANGGIEAYGGLIQGGESSEDIPQKLVDMVREQSGLDLSAVTTWYKFLEVNYADTPVPTVFYLPALWEVSSELVMTPLVREDEIERTETIQPEISREGHTDEEYQQLVAEAKPEKKVIKEIKKVLMTVPVSLTFAELQGAEVNKGMAKEVLEFYLAADSIDEFVKREMATRILLKLRERLDKQREKQEKLEQEQAVILERKRKRDDKQKERAAKRQKKLQDLEDTWKVEDEGKTEDEKKEAQAERQALRVKVMNEKGSDDEDEDEPAAKQTPAKKMRTVAVVDQACIDAFEYFDRPTTMATKVTGFMSRGRLENLLLLCDDGMCLDQVEKVMLAAGRGGQTFSYRPLATEHVQEEIPEEPKPVEKVEEAVEKAPATEAAKAEPAAQADEEPKADGDAAMEEDDEEPPTVDA